MRVWSIRRQQQVFVYAQNTLLQPLPAASDQSLAVAIFHHQHNSKSQRGICLQSITTAAARALSKLRCHLLPIVRLSVCLPTEELCASLFEQNPIDSIRKPVSGFIIAVRANPLSSPSSSADSQLSINGPNAQRVCPPARLCLRARRHAPRSRTCGSRARRPLGRMAQPASEQQKRRALSFFCCLSAES